MKRSPLSTMRGLVAALALTGAVAGAPSVVQAAPNAPSPAKEFVGERGTQRRKTKKVVRRSGGKLPSQAWQFDKQGNAIDGRGDFRRAKRLRRRAADQMLGAPLSGRAWRKARKLFRYSPFFAMPTPQLTQLTGVRV